MASHSGKSFHRILYTISGTRARPTTQDHSKIPSCPVFWGASLGPTLARGCEQGSEGRGRRSHLTLYQERKSLNFVGGTCAWANVCYGKAPFGVPCSAPCPRSSQVSGGARDMMRYAALG